MARAARARQARYNRSDTNDIDYRTRAALSWDVRQQTEYGTLRTYIRIGIQVTTPTDTEAGGAVFWDRAFMQFAGFTVGKTQSFFDLFTYGGGMSYHNVRTAGDTGAAGLTVWAYTAQFGNGFSGTLSLEAPQGHNRAPVVDVTAGRLLRQRRHRRRQRLRSEQRGRNGFRLPDIVVNLRVDQAWGFFGVSGALHDASGAYYRHRRQASTTAIPPTSSAGRLRLAAQFNLHGGDQIGANFCYSRRRWRLLHQQPTHSWYNASTSVGLGWITDGVFDNGLQRRADQGVERARRLPAHLEPEVADVALRRLRQHRVRRRRARHHQLALRAAGSAACGVPTAGAVTITAFSPVLGNNCSPELELLAGRYPDAVEPGAAARHRSRPTLLAHQHRLPGRGGGGGQQRTACDLR